MRHRTGPLYTLAAGLALALVLLLLNATTGTEPTGSAAAPSATPSASGAGSGSPSPAEESTPATSPPAPSPTLAPVPADADYAGHTKGRTASIALALRSGKVQAYVCDGRRTEAWLRGDLRADGTMRLTGKNGATLTAALKDRKITGTVRLAGGAQDFTASRKGKGTSLFRLSTVVQGRQVEGAWIVQGSEQTGIVTSDGAPSAAPPIDPETGAVTVNGQQETASPIP
ncbi:hypothetical protein AB0M28_01735 [Streptomyces sp. NPDC051940]|uniref:hypothetical protein n=1 Tax=Streptomyces sp. NPDC051940 TaxID=3155675 RepID=UPI0034160AB8